MKKQLYTSVLAVLLSLVFPEIQAQNYWAMAIVEKGTEKPVIAEYYSMAEKADNGMEYHRIYDDSWRFRGETYNPVKLQYGYRLTDKQIFIYDFESQKETLAFDFTLSADDQFTTFNGMEWKVESVKDTLVNISECGKGESVSRRLLTVKTLDGKLSDQWLEGFGSFTNHFMINSIENMEYTQALWMKYEYGEYLAREIGTDPFFAHDSGWMDGHYDGAESEPFVRCTIKDGQLVLEDVKQRYEGRFYSCFYRNGDDISKIYGWESEPHIDSGSLAMRSDVITFKGLPTPSCGKYIVHVDGDAYTASVSSISVSTQPAIGLYDLQGRKLQELPPTGIYIRNGQKIYMKNEH